MRLVIDAAGARPGVATPLFPADGEHARAIAELERRGALARLPDRVVLSLYACELAERLRDHAARRGAAPADEREWLQAPFWPRLLFEAADEPSHPAREIERNLPPLDALLFVERDVATLRAAARATLGGERFDTELHRARAPAPDQWSVDAFLFRGDELLLERRPANASSYPDQWDVPGGRVEPGETAAAALARELGEELAIVPRRARLAAVVDHRDPASRRLCRHSCYVVTEWSGDARNAEGQRLAWQRVAGLATLAPLAPPVAWIVAEARARGWLPRG
jgi:8-oxo-dGTP diphosphatase